MKTIDKPDATIVMTEPNGKKSAIRVFRTTKGADIVFARSTQGELLVMLPAYAARELGEALLAVVSAATERNDG